KIKEAGENAIWPLCRRQRRCENRVKRFVCFRKETAVSYKRLFDASLVIGVAGLFINASTTQDLCIAHPLSMSCDYPLEVFHEGLPGIPSGAPPTSPHSLIVAAASAAAATSVV
ncbi:MAG: hypothetical protein ACLPX9_03940, partial [Rhodomicrobium sp.]